MINFKKIKVPLEGEKIEVKDNKLQVPDNPIIPFIEGDGIGPDIMRATIPVLNAAVEKAYGGKRKIIWMEIYAGEKAQELYGELLPQETFEAIRHFIVALKGPLTTPVGGGYRSLNVTLRQVLDLYACVRPVRYFKGVPSPVKNPEKLNVVIFREATEDVYSGIEWEKGSKEALEFISFLRSKFNINIREDSGIGVKPISEFGTKRLIRAALRYAIKHKRKSITFVHKGNIMKYTEGAFCAWGYEVAKEEFGEYTITEKEVTEKYGGTPPAGKIVVKDRIADSMFQQVLTRPDEYDVIALPNLNGDYLSDACAAQVGGLGLAPSSNLGDYIGLFEATHGSAPKYANKDIVNPSSVMLSGAMMLEYLDWIEAKELVEKGIEKTIQQKLVTYDLARLMGDVTPIKTSEFGRAVIENM